MNIEAEIPREIGVPSETIWIWWYSHTQVFLFIIIHIEVGIVAAFPTSMWMKITDLTFRLKYI